MAIETRRLAMSGPPSVSNTGMGIEDLLHVHAALINELSELGHLSDLFECKHLIFLIAVDGKAG
jgi:hypothetical protein